MEMLKNQHQLGMTLYFVLDSLRSYYEGMLTFMKTELYDEKKQLVITDNHVGHLIPVKCGHRGKPNRIEERNLNNLLQLSGFLDHQKVVNSKAMSSVSPDSDSDGFQEVPVDDMNQLEAPLHRELSL